MKKRTKITLRTKIYLTIVALLALTGVFYAQFPPAHPTVFTLVPPIPFPTSVAAAPDLLLVSEYCSENIDKVACDGTVSLFATLGPFSGCRKKYMPIAPSGYAAALFTPRGVFGTEGANVYNSTRGSVTPFATLWGCTSADNKGITF